MNYSDYFITAQEYLEYKKSEEIPEKLQQIWADLINRIDDKDLKKEAEEKGFKIVDNPDMEDDIIAYYVMFEVPNASDELTKYLFERLYPYLVCIKED